MGVGHDVAGLDHEARAAQDIPAGIGPDQEGGGDGLGGDRLRLWRRWADRRGAAGKGSKPMKTSGRPEASSHFPSSPTISVGGGRIAGQAANDRRALDGGRDRRHRSGRQDAADEPDDKDALGQPEQPAGGPVEAAQESVVDEALADPRAESRTRSPPRGRRCPRSRPARRSPGSVGRASAASSGRPAGGRGSPGHRRRSRRPGRRAGERRPRPAPQRGRRSGSR